MQIMHNLQGIDIPISSKLYKNFEHDKYIIIIFTIARWEGHLKQTIFKEWHYMYESSWFAYGTFVVCNLCTYQIL